MRRKNLKISIIIFGLLTQATAAIAGSQAGGKVTSLIPGNNAYSFTSNGTRASTPSCATTAPNNWVIDASTPIGQGIVATVITAFASGNNIDIVGTGACPVAQPNVEAVSYVAVFP